MIIFYSIGAASSAILLPSRRQNQNNKYPALLLSYALAIIASSFAIILSLNVIVAHDTTRFSMHNVLPFINFEIKIDGIASFFIFIVGIVSLSVSIYSIGYSRISSNSYTDDDKNNKSNNKRKNTIATGSASFRFLFNIFILSMMFVIVSNNAFFFLFFWEIMSLASFFFVIQDGERNDNNLNLNSSLGYLVLTQVGTVFIIALFMVMFSQTGSFSFDSFAKSLSSSSSTAGTTTLQLSYIKNAAFILGFIGFGIKAGMVPFHAWIPRSYPLVPNNISALMTGAMINMAIYGMVRMMLDLNSVGPSSDHAWWGTVMIASGSVSAVIGVLYAIVSNDMKRTISFSSIENMGIIFIGLGLAVLFRAYGLTHLFELAIVASMLYTANHALFKSLLFMGAGSIESRTSTTNMEKLGGLAKNMPYTSRIFLIGSLAIAGLPPFNGFVSEWLTMQSLLFTSEIPSAILKISLGFASLAFALSLGISAAVFVKVFGISFLARARTNLSLYAKEVPKSMLFSKAFLALLCIILGVIPSIGINFISYAFDLKSTQLSIFGTVELQKNSTHNFASLSMPAIVAMLASFGAGAIGFLYLTGRKKRGIISKTTTTTTTKKITSSLPATEYSSSSPSSSSSPLSSSSSPSAPTWYAGYPNADSKNQYGAASFSQPIQVIFKILYRTKTNIIKTYHSETNPYLKKSIKIESVTTDVFEKYFYSSIIFVSIFTLDKIRRIQTGKINAYLLYIMITLVLLLVAVRLGL